MMKKNVVVKARVDNELADKFSLVCEFENKTSSTLLRELIEQYCFYHEEALNNFDVKVKIGEPYGRGKLDKDEFEISAELVHLGNNNAFKKINFILPEFRVNDREYYRVDSFYNYRDSFDGCITEYGRLAGAMMTDGKWKGAVFLYESKCINNPSQCFEDIKNRLRQRIITAVIKHYINNKIT